MKRLAIVLFFFFSCLISFAQQGKTDEQLGIQYYQNREYDKAIAVFSKIHAKKPNSYTYYYYYQALLETENYKELEKLVKKQQKIQPNVQRHKVDLGYVYDRANERPKAIKEYEDAIKELPANEVVVRELYNAFLSKALRDYAIQTILRGRKLLNNNKLLSKELTNVYIQLNHTDKIIEEAMMLISDTEEQSYLDQSKTILQNLLINDENQQNYLTVKSVLQKNIQKYPANNAYLSLLYWVYKMNKDYQEALVLAKAVDKRNKGNGEVVFELGKESAANRDYETAIEALNFVIAKGPNTDYYVSSRFEILNVKYQKLISSSPIKITDALLLEKEFKTILDENGIHSGNLEWTRKYARLLIFYVNKPDEGIAILEQAISLSDRNLREKAILKIDLADAQLYKGNVWDATLLYSQVDKDFPNDTIGQGAKFKNAKLSFYIGEFKWSKSQLDVLRAATSKLIANDAMYFSLLISDNEEDEEEDEEEEDALFFENQNKNLPLQYYAKADFLRFQNKDDEALIMLDSALLLAPFGKLADDILYQKAQIAIRQKDYIGAEDLLKQVIQRYSYDILADDAAFLLAELYEYHLKDIPRAMEYYQKLLKEYPGSLYVVEARKRFRALRGDNI